MFFQKGLLQVKDRHGKVRPYIRTRMQRDFAEKRMATREGKKGDIIVKARQMGVTTDVTYEQIDKVLTIPYYSAYMLAHSADDVQYIFNEKVRFAYNSLPDVIKKFYSTTKDNTKQLQIEKCGGTQMYSSIAVGQSARSKTIKFLHVSEAAYIAENPKKWKELISGSFPAAEYILIESTSKGYNGFYDLVMANIDGKGEFDVHFYNWTWEDEYTISAPKSDEWIKDYQELAYRYNLSKDPMSEHGITKAQWFWYYMKATSLKEGIKSEYPFSMSEAFAGTNNSVFDENILSRMLERSLKIKYTDEDDFTIFTQPIADHTYAVGVDPESGEGGDECGISVRDMSTPNFDQVAVFCRKAIPAEICTKSVWVANKYNQAIIACERNGNGLATIVKLDESGYQNLFHASQAKPGSESDNGDHGDKIGWETNTNTRPVMILEYEEVINDNLIEVKSIKQIKQMVTFVKKANGKKEHDTGKHDDILFADMICYAMRKYKLPAPTPLQKAPVREKGHAPDYQDNSSFSSYYN